MVLTRFQTLYWLFLTSCNFEQSMWKEKILHWYSMFGSHIPPVCSCHIQVVVLVLCTCMNSFSCFRSCCGWTSSLKKPCFFVHCVILDLIIFWLSGHATTTFFQLQRSWASVEIWLGGSMPSSSPSRLWTLVSDLIDVKFASGIKNILSNLNLFSVSDHAEIEPVTRDIHVSY